MTRHGIKHKKCGNFLVKVSFQARGTHVYPENWQYCPNCDMMVKFLQQDITIDEELQVGSK